MKPEEYKGFVIVDAPGKMFKATSIVPSAHFKRPFYGCTVESLKISINYALEKMKSTKGNIPVKNQN